MRLTACASVDDLTNSEAHKHVSVTNSLMAPYHSEKRDETCYRFKIRPERVKRLLDPTKDQRKQRLGSGRQKSSLEKGCPCSSLLPEMSFPFLYFRAANSLDFSLKATSSCFM